MPVRSPSNPDDLAAELATQLRLIVGRAKRRLREQGGSNDFKPSQVAILKRLETDGPMTVSQLARLESMKPQSMSTAIAPLIAQELVAGMSDPTDGRKTLMALTPKCRKWLVQGRAARQDWLIATIQQKLTAREQQTVATALELMSRIVE